MLNKSNLCVANC